MNIQNKQQSILKKRISTLIGITVIILVSFICGVLIYNNYIPLRYDIDDLSRKAVLEEEDKIKVIEITDSIEEVINIFIPENYDKENARFFIDDLNNDGLDEIIISAFLLGSELELFENVYLVIVTPKIISGEINKINGFKKVADFTFCADEIGYSMRTMPLVNSKEDILDIDGDGDKEIVLSLGTGGASNSAYGIFKINWEINKIDWLKIRKKDKSIIKTNFLKGGTVMHSEDFQLKDIDMDRKMEIIEKRGEYKGNSAYAEDLENWNWQIWVYKWNDSIFDYDEELSEKMLGVTKCEKFEEFDIAKALGHQTPDPPVKESCYLEFAKAQKDFSICEKIKPPFYKSACYLQLAFKLKDSLLCEKVENIIKGIDSKTSCYHVSKTYKDPISWKVYQNEKYHYELKHPENILIKEEEYSRTITFSSIDDILYFHEIPARIDSWMSVIDGWVLYASSDVFMNINIKETNYSGDFEDWLKKEWELEKFGLKEFKVGKIGLETQIEEIIIRDDFRGYVFTQCGHHCTSDYYLRQKDVIIRVFPVPNYGTLSALSKKILLTFK